MSSVTNKQLLELVSESRLLSSVAIEGEVKLLDPMALDRCLSTGNGARHKNGTFIPGSEGTKGGPGHKGVGRKTRTSLCLF